MKLSPSDDDIKEMYKKKLSDARTSVKRTTAVHTGEKKEGEDENVAKDAEVGDQIAACYSTVCNTLSHAGYLANYCEPWSGLVNSMILFKKLDI